MTTTTTERWQPTGLDRLRSRRDACEAFLYGVNDALLEQESGGVQWYVSREDVRHAAAIVKHARAVYDAALYSALVKRHGTPADSKAADRLRCEPHERALLLAGPPHIPSDPANDPHAPGDFPRLDVHWSQQLSSFLHGRRELGARLHDRPTRPAQVTFAEMSQPPEREPGDDDEPLPDEEPQHQEPNDEEPSTEAE